MYTVCIYMVLVILNYFSSSKSAEASFRLFYWYFKSNSVTFVQTYHISRHI